MEPGQPDFRGCVLNFLSSQEGAEEAGAVLLAVIMKLITEMPVKPSWWLIFNSGKWTWLSCLGNPKIPCPEACSAGMPE